uniref:pre-rRNA-processing protein TSR2 homolog isoform X2 n=1 Tax=Myxine glutinosa TaxID=7769 RepID=UPI00358FB705
MAAYSRAALSSRTSDLFHQSVEAVLQAWPVLQIVVDHGFGGSRSKQKADWLVGVVERFFTDNKDLHKHEVEDFLEDILNNEFNTRTEDGSLPQVSQQLCTLFHLCQSGHDADVNDHIIQLLHASGTTNVVQASPVESTSESEVEEAMECDELGWQDPPVNSTNPSRSKGPDADGWTLVQRRHN